MSYTATIMFAPVVTAERFDDPAWTRPGRTMYERGGLQFFPGENAAPLLVDHQAGRAIGTVHGFDAIEWTDGPWIYASATIDDPPSWLKRGTPASFGFGPVHTRELKIRGKQAEVVARALVREVSLLSPGTRPAEPCAKVLSLSLESRSPVAGSCDRSERYSDPSFHTPSRP